MISFAAQEAYRRHFLNCSYLLRTVSLESDTTLKYLSPDMPNQPDSGDRRRGQKEHLDCRQFDYTCGFVAKSFAASVDVTGAGSNCQRKYSGRSHRNRIGHQVAVFGLSDRGFDRWCKSDSGHALLCSLKGSCGELRTRSAPQAVKTSL